MRWGCHLEFRSRVVGGNEDEREPRADEQHKGQDHMDPGTARDKSEDGFHKKRNQWGCGVAALGLGPRKRVDFFKVTLPGSAWICSERSEAPL